MDEQCHLLYDTFEVITMIQKELKKYLKNEIIPLYEKNDWAHQSWHIYEVIERSLKLAKKENVNQNMVYTIAIFHDIACYQGRENHEINSAKILKENQKLREFFSEEEINIMYDAIIDHRASKKNYPKTIYGKIIATADRFTTIKGILRSTESYYLEFYPEDTYEEMFEKCYQYIEKKYGPNGYSKTYLKSEEYENFLKEVEYYLNHTYELKKIFQQVDCFLRKKYHLPKITYPQIKRYNTIDEYYKKKYKSKVYKISLNAGFSCPNIQNGHGCIFCSNQSGDFAGHKEDDIQTQFQKIQKEMEKKWHSNKYIAYFQAGTNTYAPLPILKEKFENALNQQGVIGLNIATRSDAISKEVLSYLEELNQKTDLVIELGLQSMHEKTLKFINRGHTLQNFEQMVKELSKRNIKVVVHIINGLPYETKEMMLETIKYLNKLPIWGIKIHMLHILKNTPLEKIYQKEKFHMLTKEEYINIVCDQIEILRKDIIIHRITGDPKKEDLIEPSWLLKKFIILNEIDAELEKRDSYQGKSSC